MATLPPIRWDIVEEHLDEAAFLRGQWERAWADPEYALGEVLEGPEERLLAHLDGLVVGGRRVAEKLLLPALGGDDPDLAFAAAWALLASEDGDFTAPVVESLTEGEPEAAEAVVRALQLAPRADLLAHLAPLVAKGPAEVQGRALRALAFRRLDPAVRLDALGASPNPGLRQAVLRVARLFPERVGPNVVEHLLRAPDVEGRLGAIEAGLVLGSKPAWAACESWVRAGGEGWGRAALVYALSGEKDLSPLVAGLDDEARRKEALFALGFTGRAAAVEAALGWLGEEKLAKLAAEVVTAVTGLAVEGRLAAPPKRWDPDAPEEEEEEEYGPESDLPAPKPAEVIAWWEREKKRFDPGQRWLAGKPWSIEGLVAALEEGPCRRREALALDLAIRSRGQHQLETTAWSRRQVAELAELRRGLPRGVGTYAEILKVPAPRFAAPRPAETTLRAARAASGPAPAGSLSVTAISMATSLGELAQGAAAAAAGLVRVRELREVDVYDEDEMANQPAVGHAMDAVDGFTGVARLAALAAEALEPMLPALREDVGARVGLVVALPSGHHLEWAWELNEGEGALDGAGSTPGRDHREECEGGFLGILAGLVPGVATLSQRAVVLEDATGFASALGLARKWIAAGLVERCVVGGADSLVEPTVLEAIARRDLLKGPESPCGLAPGEAAAFVVVEPSDRARRARRTCLLTIDAVAEDREPADARAGAANGRALASVLGGVLPANSAPRLFLGDLDGTTPRAQDWGSAMARRPKLVDGVVERHPAETFGSIGSAAGPVAVCLAAEAFRRGWAPGPEAVAWLWSESGARAALMLRAPPQS